MTPSGKARHGYQRFSREEFTGKPYEMPRRIQEGWRMLNLGSASGGLTAENDAALRAAEGALEAR
jgi:hypothetical protein